MTDGAPTAPGPSAPAEGAEADPDAGPLTQDEAGDVDAEPRLFVSDGLVRLSFSAIDTYQNCPAKFRYSYALRLPSRPAPALTLGSAVHHALEKFHDGARHDAPSQDDLREWLREAWDDAGFADLDEAEHAAYKRRAWSAVTRYRDRVGDDWHPAAGTEVWFEMPVDGAALVVGSIDRLDRDADGHLHVTDYKTNKKIGSRQRVESSLQLAIYALAVEHLFGRLPATVALDFVVVGEEVRVPVDRLDLDGARRAIVETAEAVKAARFPVTPNPLCDWCDFKGICPAWGGEGPDLGTAAQDVRQARRDVRASLRRLREMEAALATLSQETSAVADAQADELFARRAEERQRGQ